MEINPATPTATADLSQFEMGETLGEGSFSTVVKALDKVTGNFFAIKILDKRHIIKEKKVKYVNLEKLVLQRLKGHFYFIQLWYTFQDQYSLYFVLDLASNGELFSLIRQHSGLSLRHATFYAAEILSAIDYMHAQGIIHRDLKPENILLDEKFRIKLSDFGSAKILSDAPSVVMSSPPMTSSPAPRAPPLDERANSFVGTAEYVSPELLIEKAATKASDLWAYGCIIYQLIVNRPPFKASNDYQTFQKITNLDYVLPSYFPPDLGDIVKRLLVLNPNDRLTSAELKTHAVFSKQTLNRSDPLSDMCPPMPITEFVPANGWTDAYRKEQAFLQITSPAIVHLASQNIKRSLESLITNETQSKWKRFLYEDESIIYCGRVLKKKRLLSRTKPRFMILTDRPRLLYVDEETMMEKGEIPWIKDLKVELKDSSTFLLHVPELTYQITDPEGLAQKWVYAITSVMSAIEKLPHVSGVLASKQVVRCVKQSIDEQSGSTWTMYEHF